MKFPTILNFGKKPTKKNVKTFSEVLAKQKRLREKYVRIDRYDKGYLGAPEILANLGNSASKIVSYLTFANSVSIEEIEIDIIPSWLLLFCTDNKANEGNGIIFSCIDVVSKHKNRPDLYNNRELEQGIKKIAKSFGFESKIIVNLDNKANYPCKCILRKNIIIDKIDTHKLGKNIFSLNIKVGAFIQDFIKQH